MKNTIAKSEGVWNPLNLTRLILFSLLLKPLAWAVLYDLIICTQDLQHDSLLGFFAYIYLHIYIYTHVMCSL